jgi:transposase
MRRDEALAILDLPREKAIEAILALGDKAEKYDQLIGSPAPSTPSGMIPPYLKPRRGKSKKRPGRKKGHVGVSRLRPEQIDQIKEHALEHCPDCHARLGDPIKRYTRLTEDIPPIEKPLVTAHSVQGYWCSECKKIVYAPVSDALPNAVIGLRLVVFTAWLHYLVGVSLANIVRILSVVCRFRISAGGLTQAWRNLALLLEPIYLRIGQEISQSAVLNADETGWRLNGVTHWLWCFTTKSLAYYLITKSRGSPVVKDVLGSLFHGILICDFWGAYNKITALAKQRCFYHLFTELAKVDKRTPSPAWKAFRKKLSRLLRDAVSLLGDKEALPPETFERRKRHLYRRLEEFFTADWEAPDAKRLVKRLKRHKAELFTFLEHPNVSPYNNHGEQQMRKPVLTRKVSQQNRSAQGAKTQAILMSLFRSADLQGHNPVETILTQARALIVKPQPVEKDIQMAA